MWSLTGKSEKRGRYLYVEATCSCGTVKFVRERHVNKDSMNCGCERIQRLRERLTTHGAHNTPLYHVWEAMKSRCLNPKNPKYDGYGGRGLTLCSEWLAFEPFQEWAFSKGYGPGLSIERKNNNRGYSPDNCKWAGRIEQQNNRRASHTVEAFGEARTITEWTRDPRCLVSHWRTLLGRLLAGWDAERAISTPVNSSLAHRRKA